MQNKYDEQLYSRQIASLGAETQGKLSQMKVFLYGLKGLGVEVAKNFILAGPQALVICDEGVVEHRDLGSNFYLQKDHVGTRTRADACLEKFKELNSYVHVEIYKGQITTDILKNFNLLIFTDF